MFEKCFSNLGLPCRLVSMAAGKETLALLPPELVAAQTSRDHLRIEWDFKVTTWFFFMAGSQTTQTNE